MGTTAPKLRLASVTCAFGGGIWLSNFFADGEPSSFCVFLLLTALSGFCYNRGAE
jgi:hypothetical protein